MPTLYGAMLSWRSRLGRRGQRWRWPRREGLRRGAFFDVSGQTGGGEASGGVDDLLGGVHLDAEVVERTTSTGVLDQHQLQGGIVEGEVGVARTPFGRLGVQELGVEGDGGVDVIDVKGELDAGHGCLRRRALDRRASIMATMQ